MVAALLIGMGVFVVGPVTQDQDPEEADVMSRIINLMREAHRRLDSEFDAGPQTQVVQTRIMKELDEAIRRAAAQTQKKSPQSSADKREMGKGQQQKPANQGDPSDSQGKESSEQAGSSGNVQDSNTRESGALDELREGWGHLPARDRRELIQGATEATLKRFEKLIRQYYRTLQEAEDDNPYRKTSEAGRNP